MKRPTTMYKRHRFTSEIVQYAVWLYYRFNLSHRDIEDLLAERGITVSNESVRQWCNKFELIYACRLKKRHPGYRDTFFMDEVFVKIEGEQHYLWRAVDQDGDVVAHRELIPDTIHDTSQYANNRAELSHPPMRIRERVMRRFKSMRQAQRFVAVHAAVYDLFNLGRHLVTTKNYRFFRSRAFAFWNYAAS